jgi:hypothetical protein
MSECVSVDMKGKYKIMLLRGHNKAKEEEEITKKH